MNEDEQTDEATRLARLDIERFTTELRSVRNPEFLTQVAQAWPSAFRGADIFFKYVSWIAIIAATKYIVEKTHDRSLTVLYIAENGVLVTSLMWMCLYILAPTRKGDNSIFKVSIVLRILSIPFAIIILVLLSLPLFPLDRIIDQLEHRGEQVTR